VSRFPFASSSSLFYYDPGYGPCIRDQIRSSQEKRRVTITKIVFETQFAVLRFGARNGLLFIFLWNGFASFDALTDSVSLFAHLFTTFAFEFLDHFQLVSTARAQNALAECSQATLPLEPLPMVLSHGGRPTRLDARCIGAVQVAFGELVRNVVLIDGVMIRMFRWDQKVFGVAQPDTGYDAFSFGFAESLAAFLNFGGRVLWW